MIWQTLLAELSQVQLRRCRYVKKKITMMCIFLALLVPIVSADYMNSANYKGTFEVSTGNDNLTSTNYKADIILDSVSINISSANYKGYIGFLYSNNSRFLDIVSLLVYFEDNGIDWILYNWTYTGDGYSISNVWLIDNETEVLISNITNPTDLFENFSGLSKNRDYTISVRLNSSDTIIIERLTANTDTYTDRMDLMIFLSFLIIVVVLLYFYFGQKVIYFGVLAGVMLVLLGAFLAATGNIAYMDCFSNRIRETTEMAALNVTNMDYHVICDYEILPLSREMINALGIIFMFIGAGVVVDFINVMKRKPDDEEKNGFN